PIVLGGDCTITLGVVAGLLRHQPDLGLIYFDGDADLTTPETTHSGIFDSMGVAHLIGQGDPDLAHIGPRFPLLEQDRIILFGFHPYEIEPEESRVLDASACSSARRSLLHWSLPRSTRTTIPTAYWCGSLSMPSPAPCGLLRRTPRAASKLTPRSSSAAPIGSCGPPPPGASPRTGALLGAAAAETITVPVMLG